MTRVRSVGLEAFRKVIGSKHVDQQKIQVRPETNFLLSVASSLVQTVIGVEGMKVFPSLFLEDQSNIPRALFDKCEVTILQHQLERKQAKPPLETHHNSSLVSKIVRDIMSNQLQSNSGSLIHQEQVTSSAGWKTSNMWLEVSSVADEAFYSPYIFHAREDPDAFATSVKGITSEEKESLISAMPFRCFRGGGIDFFCSSTMYRTPRYLTLGAFGTDSTTSMGDYDSRSLLFTATTLINQAWTYNVDVPQIGYSVICDGRILRFVAFQLNTLLLDDKITADSATSTKNAGWIYETELFTLSNENNQFKINPEALGILINILQKQS